MDEQKIREAIAVLDQEVPREGARVKLSQYGGGPDEGQVIANQTGYLRLGIEFLKGAYPPVGGDPASTGRDVDLKYLVTDDSIINFDWFECRESIESETTAPSGAVAWLVLIAVLVAFVMLPVIGAVTVVKWFLK